MFSLVVKRTFYLVVGDDLQCDVIDLFLTGVNTFASLIL